MKNFNTLGHIKNAFEIDLRAESRQQPHKTFQITERGSDNLKRQPDGINMNIENNLLITFKMENFDNETVENLESIEWL